jgi:hypothetical protein
MTHPIADALHQAVADLDPGAAIAALVATAGRLHAAANGLPAGSDYRLFRCGEGYATMYDLAGNKVTLVGNAAFAGHQRVLKVTSAGAVDT